MCWQLQKRGDALEKVDIPKQAVIQGQLAQDGSRLAVSHRWMDPIEPDEDGKQTEAIRTYLTEHPEVNLVWFDFWRVPRGHPSLLRSERRAEPLLACTQSHNACASSASYALSVT